MTENLTVKPEDCVGFTKPAAGAYLKATAQSVPQGFAIMEVGVHQCRSLLYLAEGSALGNQVPVHGVDPYNLPGERYPFAWTQEKRHRSTFTTDATYEAAQWNIAHYHRRDLVVLHRNFSVDLAAEWQGPKIALLHVDGLHTEEGVRNDFEAWAPHLAPNAVICWDDWVRNCQPVIDVTMALFREGKITEPKLAPGSRRLAVTRFLTDGKTH